MNPVFPIYTKYFIVPSRDNPGNIAPQKSGTPAGLKSEISSHKNMNADIRNNRLLPAASGIVYNLTDLAFLESYLLACLQVL